MGTRPTAGRPREVVLSVRSLRTEFRTSAGVVRAVRDVSLQVRRGEKVGVVGESGCGKSALALSILGLIEPPGRVAGGEVELNGRVVSLLRDRSLRRVRGNEVSLVFQDPMTALDPVQTIGAQIVEAIRKHQNVSRKVARRQAIALLRDVDVPFPERRFASYPHEYSGGMRQRVLIAIAIANNPDLLIADEPTTALDVTTQAQVLDLLEKLVEEHHAAIMLITHNLGIVAEFCDRVNVMYAGRIVEQADVEQVFARPVHPYTEALLRSVPRPDELRQGPLPTIAGLPPSLIDLPAGCPFEPRCPVGQGRRVCRDEAPSPTTVGPGSAPVVVECHFARERETGAPLPDDA